MWWASSFRAQSSRTPSWGKNGEGEAVGLRIDDDMMQNGAAEVRVAVHDMSPGMLEAAYKYAMAWSDTDPLFQYIGQARVSVCKQQRQAEWRVISSSKGCQGY